MQLYVHGPYKLNFLKKAIITSIVLCCCPDTNDDCKHMNNRIKH